MYQITLAGVQTLSSWQGDIHSIYNGAVNIISNRGRFTLLFNPLWISENNIVVSCPTIVNVISQHSIVSSDGAYLYIDGVAKADYQKCTPWAMPHVAFASLEQKSIERLTSFLAARPRDGLLQQIEATFTDEVNKFIDSKQADFSRIIGAGPGLTPSSDDMLVGFSLALWFYCPQWLPILAARCAPFLAYTTDVSRYLLLDAFSGRFSAPLIEVLLALRQGTNLDMAMSVAANIGSSSGHDGMFGLYQGIKQLNRSREGKGCFRLE